MHRPGGRPRGAPFRAGAPLGNIATDRRRFSTSSGSGRSATGLTYPNICSQRKARPSSRRALPSRDVDIDEDLLINAVRALNEAKSTAHAESVSKHLGPIADDGGCFEAQVVADELEELESRGKLKRAPAVEWNDSEQTPKTRITYALPD
jgi:hypothetical protein